MLLAGVRAYAGRAFPDQFNYTSLAQFILERPFRTGLEDVCNCPCFAPAVLLKTDRIGQSVLHAFFAATSFQDAQPLFEPTIVLAPALVVVAVYLIGARLGLGRGLTLAVAVTAGVLPALTLLHLESFLSHVLAVPFLLMGPVLAADLAARPGWRPLLRAALILTAAASIYTELWPILLAIPAVVLGPAVLRGPRRGALVLCGLVLVLSPLLLNMGMLRTLRVVLIRLDRPGVLAHAYPWAFTVEGWSRLWLGDLAAKASGVARPVVRIGALAVTALACYGWVQRALAEWRAGRRGRRVRAGFALSLTGLVLLPLVLVARDTEHPYQFYKMLLTSGPLLVVGWALFARALCRPAAEAPPCRVALARRLPVLLVLGVVSPAALAGTAAMVLASADPVPAARTNGPYFMALGDLARCLGGLRGALVIAAPRALEDGWYNGWMAYFGRANPVWILNPSINHGEPPWGPESRRAFTGEHLPAAVHILAGSMEGVRASPPAGGTRLWSHDGYELWQMNGPGWALPLGLKAPGGVERGDGQPLFWTVAEPARLEVLAGGSGTLACDAALVLPDPVPAGTGPRALRIQTSRGHEVVLKASAGAVSFTLPLPPGRTTLLFSAVGVPRVGVRGLCVRFTPAEGEKESRVGDAR
jgi:hypothetical protein